MHLAGLSEVATNKVIVIRLTYAIEDHCADGVPDTSMVRTREEWLENCHLILRDLDTEALRFPDPKVRHLVQWGHAETLRDPDGVAEEQPPWPTARYRDYASTSRTAMESVLRREPFPDGIWSQFPGARPPS